MKGENSSKCRAKMLLLLKITFYSSCDSGQQQRIHLWITYGMGERDSRAYRKPLTNIPELLRNANRYPSQSIHLATEKRMGLGGEAKKKETLS